MQLKRIHADLGHAREEEMPTLPLKEMKQSLNIMINVLISKCSGTITNERAWCSTVENGGGCGKLESPRLSKRGSYRRKGEFEVVGLAFFRGSQKWRFLYPVSYLHVCWGS